MLISLLDDVDIAAAAAWSLGRRHEDRLTSGLIALARNGTDYQRSEAIKALIRIWDAQEALTLATDPGNPLAGRVLVKELWRWKDEYISPGLIELLDIPDLAADAAMSLGRLKAKSAINRLSQLASSGTREQRRAAEGALKRISPPPKDPNKVPADYWYRNPRWDEAAREVFEAKLARARGTYSRAHYLKIKAWSLTGTTDPKTIAAGRSLFARVIEEHSDELSEVEGAHHGLGESFAREGRYEEAVRHFEKGIEAGNRHSRYGAQVCLAEAIVAGRLAHRYDRALEVLAEYNDEKSDFNLKYVTGAGAWKLRGRASWSEPGIRASAAQHADAALKLLGQGHNYPGTQLLVWLMPMSSPIKEMEGIPQLAGLASIARRTTTKTKNALSLGGDVPAEVSIVRLFDLAPEHRFVLASSRSTFYHLSSYALRPITIRLWEAGCRESHDSRQQFSNANPRR